MSVFIHFFTLCRLVKAWEKLASTVFSPQTAREENRHYFFGDPVSTDSVTFHDWDQEQICLDYLQSYFHKHNERFV